MKKTNRLSSQKGWILFDAIIGMVIFITAILALSNAYLSSAKANVYAKNYGQALSYIQQYAENHKSLNNTNFTPKNAFAEEYQPPGTKTFTITPSIGAFIDTNTVPVTVTATWEGGKVSITSCYYRKANQ